MVTHTDLYVLAQELDKGRHWEFKRWEFVCEFALIDAHEALVQFAFRYDLRAIATCERRPHRVDELLPEELCEEIDLIERYRHSRV